MLPVIAIYDIGKTNKKLLLFDEAYKVIEQSEVRFKEIEDDEGFPCDDIHAIINWVQKSWVEFEEGNKYEIRAVNFTTYGASFVHVDQDDKIVAPLYNYLKAIPEDILDQFYDQYGVKSKIALETASPSLGMLNSGLQLYWLKVSKPELFDRIRYSFPFPNYLSYIFAKNAHSDYTSLGCHTALWNFREGKYHNWVKEESIDKKLPPLLKSNSAGQTPFRGESIPVGSGLHDSSSALSLYMQMSKDPFLLISSGTWNVTFNPFAEQPITKEELLKDCLSYMTLEGKPVKASRIFLGNEHDFQVKRLAEHFNRSEDLYKNIDLDKDLLASCQNVAELSPATMNGTGPFPDKQNGEWSLAEFNSYEQAYHRLILDLVRLQKVSINLISEGKKGGNLYVDGGFSMNNVFMQLLAEFCPEYEVKAAKVSQATATGAALFMNDVWRDRKKDGWKFFNFKSYKAIGIKVDSL